VIGVGTCFGGDFPGVVPGKTFLVDEDAHELRDGKGRVRVVELDGDFFWEGGEVVALDFTAAELGGLEATDYVLEGGCAKEVLLFQAQVFAFRHLVSEKK